MGRLGRGTTVHVSVDLREAVRVATTAPVANLGSVPATIDGVTVVAGDRVLVKDGASTDGIVAVSHAHDGIYSVSSVGGGLAVLARATDADASAEFVHAMVTQVTAGTLHAGKYFAMVVVGSFTLGTTLQRWVPWSDSLPATRRREHHVVTSGENTAGKFTLLFTPVAPEDVSLSIRGGVEQANARADGVVAPPDFEVVGADVKINASSSPSVTLSGDITSGDEVIVEYEA